VSTLALRTMRWALALADDVVMLNAGRVPFAGGVEAVRGIQELISQQRGVV
jgi:hypothetical protein